MALLNCQIYSEVLHMHTHLTVLLPDPLPAAAPQDLPLLYLLHGLSDDHTIWTRRTSIERYLEGVRLAVVMPEVQRSFYTDMVHGPRWFAYLSEELPQILRGMFRISAEREDTFAAGLSMGGYGAFKLALSFPERFAAAASLSGALDMASEMNVGEPDWQREMEMIFGDPAALPGSRNDLLALADDLARSAGPHPVLYQYCGTEDFLYPANQRFLDRARALQLDLQYHEGPGDHRWQFWDEQIQQVLAWLPIRAKAG